MQLAMGLARLGALVNFISHTVIVGFTAGAGLLIIAAQLPQFLRRAAVRPAPASSRACTRSRATSRRSIRGSRATGVVTLVVAVVAKQTLRRVPYMIVAMIVGSAFAYVLAQRGASPACPRSARLPSGLPVLSLPSFDPERLAQARAGRAGADRAGAHRGGVDRARRSRSSRASASTATRSSSARACRTSRARSRRRIRRPARSTAAASTTKPARTRRSRRCSRRSLLVAHPVRRRAARRLPAAGRHGRAAVRRRVGPHRLRRDPADRAHQPRRPLRARRDVRRRR